MRLHQTHKRFGQLIKRLNGYFTSQQTNYASHIFQMITFFLLRFALLCFAVPCHAMSFSVRWNYLPNYCGGCRAERKKSFMCECLRLFPINLRRTVNYFFDGSVAGHEMCAPVSMDMNIIMHVCAFIISLFFRLLFPISFAMGHWNDHRIEIKLLYSMDMDRPLISRSIGICIVARICLRFVAKSSEVLWVANVRCHTKVR